MTDLPFICTDGQEHMIGKRYDERRGVGNGPQICLKCKEPLAALLQAEVLKARENELELAEHSNMFRNQTGLPMFIRHEEYIESRKAEMQAQANKQKEVS